MEAVSEGEGRLEEGVEEEGEAKGGGRGGGLNSHTLAAGGKGGLLLSVKQSNIVWRKNCQSKVFN